MATLQEQKDEELAYLDCLPLLGYDVNSPVQIYGDVERNGALIQVYENSTPDNGLPQYVINANLDGKSFNEVYVCLDRVSLTELLGKLSPIVLLSIATVELSS